MLICTDLCTLGTISLPQAARRTTTSRFASIPLLVVAAALVAAPAFAQQPIPRAADGKPDLQGIWQATTTAAADLQDHLASLNNLAGRSVIVGAPGSPIPYLPWAVDDKDEERLQEQL